MYGVPPFQAPQRLCNPATNPIPKIRLPLEIKIQANKHSEIITKETLATTRYPALLSICGHSSDQVSVEGQSKCEEELCGKEVRNLYERMKRRTVDRRQIKEREIILNPASFQETYNHYPRNTQ